MLCLMIFKEAALCHPNSPNPCDYIRVVIISSLLGKRNPRPLQKAFSVLIFTFMTKEGVEHDFSLAFKVVDQNVMSKRKKKKGGKKEVLNSGALELPLYLNSCQTAASKL